MKQGSSALFFAFFSLIFLVIFTFTLGLMAGPYIVSDLGGSNDISTYALAFYGVGNALGVPLGNQLTAKIKPKKLLIGCLLLFAFFCWISAAATNYPFFIAMRFAQGIVAGPFYFLFSYFMATLAPRDKQQLFFSILITIFTVVPVLGACWGGTLSYLFTWRLAFYLNVPIILLLTLVFMIKMKHIDQSPTQKKQDPIGYIFFALGVFCLSTLVITGQELDWFRSDMIIFLAIAGILSLGFFITWALNRSDPVLDLHLFKNPIFTYGLTHLAFLFSIYFGTVILLSQWLTIDVNYTPLWISLLVGTMAVAGCIPTFLIVKFNTIDCRLPLAIAIVLLAFSCFHTTLFNEEVNFGRIAFSRTIAGFGLVFFLPPIFRMCFHSFPEERSTRVLEIFQVVRALSSSLGASIFTTIWQRRQVFYHDRLGGQITVLSPETHDYFMKAQQVDLTGLPAFAKLNDLLNKRSTALALDDCFWLMGWILIGLLGILCFTTLMKSQGFVPEKNPITDE